MNNGQTNNEGQTDGQTISPVRSFPGKDRRTDRQTHNLRVQSGMVKRRTDTQSAHAEDVACAVHWSHHAAMTFIVPYSCVQVYPAVCALGHDDHLVTTLHSKLKYNAIRNKN